MFATERLLIRPWTSDPADVARVYAIYSNPDVARWLGTTPRVMADESEAAAMVARWRDRSSEDPRLGLWAVQVRQTGLVAGSVLVSLLPPSDGATPTDLEVGWHLHPDSWGHGYATEAARAAIDRTFALGARTIYAVVYPDNAPSLAVCRRLGMTPLGRTSRWYGVEAEAFRVDAHAAAGARHGGGELPA